MPYKDKNSPEYKESRKQIYKRYKERHPDRYKRLTKNANLKKSFGITLADYERMLAAQNGLCAICQKPEKYSSKNPQSSGQLLSLAVDHDHAKNRVRELLCMACNKGIGCFEEDILRLQAAIEYIRKHAGEN